MATRPLVNSFLLTATTSMPPSPRERVLRTSSNSEIDLKSSRLRLEARGPITGLPALRRNHGTSPQALELLT
jgi:hypothetical protein